MNLPKVTFAWLLGCAALPCAAHEVGRDAELAMATSSGVRTTHQNVLPERGPARGVGLDDVERLLQAHGPGFAHQRDRQKLLATRQHRDGLGGEFIRRIHGNVPVQASTIICTPRSTSISA